MTTQYNGYRQLSREFVLQKPEDVAQCSGFIKSLVVLDPRGWLVTITPNQQKRTGKQNKRGWSVMRYIASCAWVRGERFSAEAWHAHYCGEFIGWEDMPNGERLPVGASTLETAPYNEWLKRVIADAQEKHGVDFSHWDERET